MWCWLYLDMCGFVYYNCYRVCVGGCFGLVGGWMLRCDFGFGGWLVIWFLFAFLYYYFVVAVCLFCVVSLLFVLVFFVVWIVVLFMFVVCCLVCDCFVYWLICLLRYLFGYACMF